MMNSIPSCSGLDAAEYVSSRIGEPFHRVERHCWWLVRSVYRDRLGVDLPPILDQIPEGIRQACAVTRELFTNHPERARWLQVAEPRDMALVLMRKPFFEHAGVFMQVGPGGVLHSDEPHGVVFDSLLQVRKIRGFDIAGFFVRVHGQ